MDVDSMSDINCKYCGNRIVDGNNEECLIYGKLISDLKKELNSCLEFEERE
jgi:hypothetical protein